MESSNKVVFLISAPAGAGKSTLAKALYSSAKMSKLIAFADPLKSGLASVFGIPASKLSDPAFKKTVEPISGKTWRSLMQSFGEEWGRVQVRDDLWARLALREVENDNRYHTFIIQDCRYPNEVSLFKSSPVFETVVIKVVPFRNEVIPESGHKSESLFDQIVPDYTYVNMLCEKRKAVNQAKTWVDRNLVDVLKKVR